MKLIKKEIIEKPEKVYNLHIKDDHNYIANSAIVSNCHQAKSDVLTSILTKTLNEVPLRRGFTGTLPKEPYEAKSIIASVGEVIHRVNAKDLQDKGILAKCHVCGIITDDNFVSSSYDQELNQLLTNKDRIDFMVDFIKKVCETGNTLVLVGKIDLGKELEERIKGSTFVYGKTKIKDRQLTFKSVQNNDNVPIISTFQVAAVGINIPRIFNLVMIEAGKSFVRVIQTIGRGVRKAHDKDFVQIYDLSSTSKFSKKHFKKRMEYYDEAEYPYDSIEGKYSIVLNNYDTFKEDL